MKAILEFDMNEPDEMNQMQRMLAVDDLCLYIHEIDQYIREKYKYSDEESINIERLRDDIHDLKSDAVHMVMERWN